MTKRDYRNNYSKTIYGNNGKIKMPSHDIIDNRNEKLSDHINTILQGTEMPMIQTNRQLTTINGHCQR